MGTETRTRLEALTAHIEADHPYLLEGADQQDLWDAAILAGWHRSDHEYAGEQNHEVSA